MDVQAKIKSGAVARGIDPALALALAQQESGFRQYDDTGNVLTSSAGALGVMQLMPETAAGLGVDPTDEDANISGGLDLLKEHLNNYGGDVQLALAAYNAGAGAVEKYGGVPPYEETQNYVKSITALMQTPSTEPGFNFFDSLNHDEMTHGIDKIPALPQEELTATPSVTDKIILGAADEALSSVPYDIGKLIYGAMVHSSSSMLLPSNYQITQEDIKAVQEALPGNEAAQRFVLINARDQEELRWLTSQEIEKSQRRQKLAEVADGWTFAGSLVGGLANPLNYITAGHAATGLKIMARTGGAVKNVAKIAKYASIGAEAAVTNVADDYLRTTVSSDDFSANHYAQAAAIGFLAGGTLSALGDAFIHMRTKNKDIDRVASMTDMLETNAVKRAADLDITARTAIANETFPQAKMLHDAEWGKGFKNKIVEAQLDTGRVLAMTRKEAQQMLDSYGITLPEKGKGFHVPNEKYTIIFKDKIKNSRDAVNLLKHEFIHSSAFKDAIGSEKYNALLSRVADEAAKEGTIFEKAQRLAHTADPEEVLAYAIEHEMLDRNTLQYLGDTAREGLRKFGVNTKMTHKEINKLIAESLKSTAAEADVIYVNPDGSTTFAGIKWSKDNIANPALYADYIDTEDFVLGETQAFIQGGSLKAVNRILAPIGKMVESGSISPAATPFGVTINSPSKTLRKYAVELMDDPSMRGLKKSPYLCAEKQKEYVSGKLKAAFSPYLEVRKKWAAKRLLQGQRENPFIAFDKQCILCYNETYARRTKSGVHWDSEVVEGAARMREYFTAEEEISKNSADMFGIKGRKNLMDYDWTPVDFEFMRLSNTSRLDAFRRNFGGDLKASKVFYENYVRAAFDRATTAAKIKRSIEMENARLPDGATPKSTAVTDKMIDEYLEQHIKAAVDNMINPESLMHKMEYKTGADGAPRLGNLRYHKNRIPMDTSLIMTMPNGREFSFDNNLRNYDMDYMITRRIERVAGEVAITNTFKNNHEIEKMLSNIGTELQYAVTARKINPARKDFELNTFKDFLRELQGLRPDRERLGRVDALARIMQAYTYYKQGAMMMFSQLGEVGTAMAYAGPRALFSTFKPLRQLYDNMTLGKVSAEYLDDAIWFMYGDKWSNHIFDMNFTDRVINEALTSDSITDKIIRGTADSVNLFAKSTSFLNRVSQMTNTMTGFIQKCTLTDSIRWAHGATFSKFRNPFSVKKLKAANISATEAQYLQQCLRDYFPVDAKGRPMKPDIESFQKQQPVLYHKWRDLIQQQADRSLVNGVRASNRSLLKDMNSFTRLLFQFKDFTLRAMNSQTMRVLHSREIDDFIAMGMSVVTNIAAVMGLNYATYLSMLALNDKAGAEKYYRERFNPDYLTRLAIVRSTIIGTPLSMGNDLWEAMTGAPTIRTTVERPQRFTGQHDRSMSDIAGDFVAQIPSINTAGQLGLGTIALYDMMADNATDKRNFRRIFKASPVPNLVPLTVGANTFIKNTRVPEQLPKRKKEGFFN